MIYIKRIIWALGWIPMFVIGLVLCLMSMFLFPFIASFYYIKNGDIETTPDKFLPMRCTILLENAYRKLEPKSKEDKERDICQTCKHYWTDFRVVPEKVYVPRCDMLIKQRGWSANMDEVIEYPCLKCPFDSYEQGKNECHL